MKLSLSLSTLALASSAIATTTLSTKSSTSVSSSAHSTFSIDSRYIELANKEIEEIKKTETCHFTTEELYQHAVSFANDYLYPNNLNQSKVINSTYFSEDVMGRIDITRNYLGKELNTEYLFSLFTQLSDSSVANLIGYSTSYDMYEFVSNCNEYSMTVVNNGTFPTLNNASLPIAVNIWFKLNEYKEIVQYDLTFLKFERLFPIIELAAYRGLSGNSTATTIPAEGYTLLKKALANSICKVHQKYCAAKYAQYDSEDACITYLMNDVRLGTDYEGGMNTVFCRSLHQNMIEYRPSVHCPHIGASGGDMCNDTSMGFLDVTYNYKTTFRQPWVVV